MSSYGKYSPASSGASLTLPVSIANGGTNSSAALTNGKMMQSLGGAIVESPVSISGNNLTLPGTLVSGTYHIEPSQDSQTASTGATTIDLGTAAGKIVTLAASTTLTLSNPQTGAAYALQFTQGAGSFTVTWPGTVKWAGGVAPVISVANGAIDQIHLYYNGSVYLGSFVQNFQ